MEHVLIVVCSFLVILLEWAWRERRRRQRLRRLPHPDRPVHELLLSSGRFKAVAFGHDEVVLRVDVFRRVDHEGDEPLWVGRSWFLVR